MQAVLKAGHRVDGRFELVRRLGSGAIGVVWLAKDHEQRRDVALKLLHHKLVNDRHAVGQLVREAQVLDQLEHPYIARLYEFAPSPPNVYLSIEFVDGAPLHVFLGEHSKANNYLPHEVVRALFSQLCSAVGYAHEKRIVHRDLKPHNIMIVESGALKRAKVLDFGIARLLEGSSFDATTFGRQLGSLFYMSPEQTRGEPADVRSDVFGLGAIFFELLTLHRAWARDADGRPVPAFKGPMPAGEANSIATVFTRLSHGERPRPSSVRAALGQRFDDITVRALAADPGERFQTVGALAEAVSDAFDTLMDPRTEMLLEPQIAFDDDETRLERRAEQESATQVAAEFGELSDAGPTDRNKKQVVPETAPYLAGGAAHNVPPTALYMGNSDSLEEAGPTVAASDPLKLTEAEPQAVIDTNSIVGPADTRSLDHFASDERPLPRTNTGAASRLRWPLIGAVFGVAVAVAASATIAIREPPAPPAPPITVPLEVGQPRYDFSEIDALLARVKADPEDSKTTDLLIAEIQSAAEQVKDDPERKQIEKIAELSSLVRNVEGLESAVDRLKAALR